MYINADVRLNPELDELPALRREEPSEKVRDPNNTVVVYGRPRPQAAQIIDKAEPQLQEAEELRAHAEPAQEITAEAAPTQAALSYTPTQASELGDRPELTLRDALQDGPQLDAILEMLPGFMTTLKAGYTDDPLFKKVLANTTAYPNFTERDR
ncbi:hypothetical protein LXA43DRAFT_1063537 [Ganoderma leucocontextum]|nr:hypothetical protein LXA43DRAFT_1063537 [Ganoderma leucocontextum]